MVYTHSEMQSSKLFATLMSSSSSLLLLSLFHNLWKRLEKSLTEDCHFTGSEQQGSIMSRRTALQSDYTKSNPIMTHFFPAEVPASLEVVEVSSSLTPDLVFMRILVLYYLCHW